LLVRFFAAAAFAVASVSSAELPTIAVVDVRAAPGTDPNVVSGISALLPVEAGRRQLKVTSGSDVRAMLDLERQRQLLGCTDNECSAEIGAALGTQWLLLSEVSELGGQWLLTLSLVHLAGSHGLVGREVLIRIDHAGPYALRGHVAPETHR
jgi:hypothetical protein